MRVFKQREAQTAELSREKWRPQITTLGLGAQCIEFGKHCHKPTRKERRLKRDQRLIGEGANALNDVLGTRRKGFRHRTRGPLLHTLRKTFRCLPEAFRCLPEAFRCLQEAFRCLPEAFRYLPEAFR